MLRLTPPLRALLLPALLLPLLAPAQTVPDGGVPLVAADDIALEGDFYGGAGPVAEYETIAVDDEAVPFTEAARITVLQPTGEFWSSALTSPSVQAVSEGDVALLHFFLRAEESMDETGAVSVQVYVEGPGPGFVKSISQQVTAGPEWVEYFLPFEIAEDYTAGQLSVNFGFGSGEDPSVLDLGGVEVLWYGTDLELEDLPVTSFHYDGRDPNAAWRAEAEARIEQHRKADFEIQVVDADGAPVPEATVRVQLRRHAFPFGTAFQSARIADREDPDNAIYRQTMVDLFNAASPENDLKWQPWEGEWGDAFNQEQTLTALGWLKERGFHLRGHVLVWPSERNLPERLGPLLDTEDPSLPEEVRAHIEDVVTATEHLLDEWDVLNEPFDNFDLMQMFGDDIMIDWFEEAREHHADAKLFINDYGILSGGGLNTAHQDHYEDTIAFLVDGGAPIDGIGMQGHFESSPTGIPRVWSILERYATAFPDLEIKITEFDVDTADEELQADYTRDFLTLVFSHPSVTGFQVWGFWEDAHWRPRAAMYRSNWEEKPNGAAFRELVHDVWHTDETAETDADGEVSGRGFHGLYDVTVTVGERSITRRMTLPAEGASWTVTLEPSGDQAHLHSLSTLGVAGQGHETLIAGMVLPEESDVLVRAVGQTLVDFDVEDPVADPRLAVFEWEAETPAFENDNWEPAVADWFEPTGAFPLEGDPLSSALALEGVTGSYTAHLRIPDAERRAGLVEVYDAAGPDVATPRLRNVSTRGLVGVDDQPLAAGFVVDGPGTARLLIRGVGPGLAQFDLEGALADPELAVYSIEDEENPIAVNTEWGGNVLAEDLAVIAEAVGAFALEDESGDTAVLLELPAGGYAIELTSGDGETGIGLIEIYHVD